MTRFEATGREAGSGGFRFAHTSLQEYSLAHYLFEAVRHNRPDECAMPVPSPETLEFLGQMADEGLTGDRPVDAVQVLQQWKHAYRPQTSELLLAYALAAHRVGRPAPVLARMDLSGGKLREWTLAVPGDDAPARRFDLSGVRLTNADLRDARLQRVKLDGASLNGARCERAEFESCSLAGADLGGALGRGSRG